MKSLKALLMLLVFVASLAATQAQLTPTRTGSALSNIVTCSLTTTNLPASLMTPIELAQGKGIAFTPLFVGAQSTNTGVAAFQFVVSTDGGTTYTTTRPLIGTSTANGTTAVRDYILFDPTELNGATHIKLATITNALANAGAGCVTVTNVYYSIP